MRVVETHTAKFYSQYRREYPKEFLFRLLQEFSVNDSHRVLDIGTGIGQVAISIAPYVREVVALDADKQILKEGEERAFDQKISNITWINARAENISPTLGEFKLVTTSASFHLMDRERVLEKIHPLVTEGGGVAIIDAATLNVEPWWDEISELIARYVPPHKHPPTPSFETTHEEILSRSLFTKEAAITYRYSQEWSVSDILRIISSLSYACERLFEEKLAEFKAEARNIIERHLAPEGVFIEEVELTALIGKK